MRIRPQQPRKQAGKAIFFLRTFPTARRSVSYDSPTASYYYVRSHLGPQGQAAGRLVSGEVEHTVQCWADARRRRWDGWPRAPQGCACNGELDRDRQGSPPTSRPPRGRGATHCGRCATKCCAVAFQRPPISEPSTSSFCGPPPSRAPGTCCACAAPRPLAQPRPLPLCMDAGALSS